MQMQNKGIQESMYLRRGVKSQMLKKLKQHREMGKEIPKEQGKRTDIKLSDTAVTKLEKEKVKDLEIIDTVVDNLEPNRTVANN